MNLNLNEICHQVRDQPVRGKGSCVSNISHWGDMIVHCLRCLLPNGTDYQTKQSKRRSVPQVEILAQFSALHFFKVPTMGQPKSSLRYQEFKVEGNEKMMAPILPTMRVFHSRILLIVKPSEVFHSSVILFCSRSSNTSIEVRI